MELKIEGLTKRYGEKLALNNVSMTLTDGVYGLLGPNGAGKSTIMNILAGNLKASSGEVSLDGKSIRKNPSLFRDRLGYMPQSQCLYPDFTSEQFLFYISSLRRMEKQRAARRVDEVLRSVALSSVKKRRIDTLSGGMRQRLLFAQAILNEPDILILDEPSAGLDPKQRIALRNLIGELSLNKIVLISTHIVSDVECIAKEFLFLSQGQILKKGTYTALTTELSERVHEYQIPENRLREAEQLGRISNVYRESGGEYTVRMVDSILPDAPGRSVRPTLEDVYLELFGEGENHEI